ncbi:MAG: hypothetical protein L6R28_21095, partial [Planctomycetes bacterium]|nr:hypothetical protein [Planctomycetota bacterium]
DTRLSSYFCPTFLDVEQWYRSMALFEADTASFGRSAHGPVLKTPLAIGHGAAGVQPKIQGLILAA